MKAFKQADSSMNEPFRLEGVIFRNLPFPEKMNNDVCIIFGERMIIDLSSYLTRSIPF